MKPRPLVAHITTVDMGLKYLLANQMRWLEQAGFEVVGISGPGPYLPDLLASGLRHYQIPFDRRPVSPINDLRAFLALVRTLRQVRPTIVHTHNPKPTLYAQVAARLVGVPIVINTLHGYLFTEHTPPLKKFVLSAFERIAAPFADIILSQNREDVATAAREGICPPDKIRFLGNGIDIARFDQPRTAEWKSASRKELGLADEHLVVGFVGRLVAEKGLMELFQAVICLKDRLPHLRLLIIGPSDPDKPDSLSEDVAAQLGIADLCVFTGLRNDVENLYPLMDIFALPSHREGFPRSPMEASATGVPCIATDVRGCREVVFDGKNGLLVPVRDASSLAQAILTLTSDVDLRLSLGRNAKQLAQEEFDERRVFEQVQQTYREFLSKKSLAF